VSKSPIPVELGRRVAREALYRCGYCLALEVIGVSMQFDHFVPTSRGGRTVRTNLWLACDLCNGSKSGRVRALDPVSRRQIRLYNPRRDKWKVHFEWIDDGLRIKGRTDIGRATVAVLKLNSRGRVTARRLWISAGWHPPRD
jgi:hypothetical protein